LTSRLPSAVLAFALAACPGPPGGDLDAARVDLDAARTDTDGGAMDGGAPDAPDAAAAEPADAADAEPPDAAASEPADAAAPTLGAGSVAELWATLQATPDGGDKGFLLVNVHVPYEGSIPGTDAHLTYLDPDAIAAYVGGDLDRPVVVYCRSNYMSRVAGDALVAWGYRAVRYLDGGMNGWSAAGHPLDP